MTMARGNHAFSLLELLVCVGVLAVLIGLLGPALNTARRASAQIACMTEMRQQATLIMSYAANNRDSVPFFFQRHPDGDLIGHGGRRYDSQYFGITAMYWFVPMLEDGSISDERTLVCGQAGEQGARQTVPTDDEGTRWIQPTGRWISRSFYLRPASLNAPSVQWSPALSRVARLTDVMHPASKVLHLESRPNHSSRSVPDPTNDPISIVATDGSARTLSRRQAHPGVVVEPLPPWPPSHGALDEKRVLSAMEHTMHGIHGLDF